MAREQGEGRPAAVRGAHLLGRYAMEALLARHGALDEDAAIVIGILLDTCHGCGDELLVRGSPPSLLCPRCEREAVWLRN